MLLTLGEGSYGKVKKIKTDGTYFALKETTIPNYPEELEVVMACLREEAMNLVHPHIIQRHWCRFWKNKFQICMELGQPVYRADGPRILHDITQALYFMHSKGFIHRDVKPENIVQVGNVYKLIDFGLSRKTGVGATHTAYMVSRWFRPPELLESKEDLQYDGRVDMYSVALTAYFLQNQKPLFYGETPELLSMYRKYEPSGLLGHLICDYEKRFSAKQLLDYCKVTPIEGTESELPVRKGNVAIFASMMRKGKEHTAVLYGHKNIYSEL